MRSGVSVEARFGQAVDRLVAFMEKDRLPLLGIFVYVLFLSLFRDISEYYLLDHLFVIEPHPWIYSIAHHVAFYFLTYLGLVLLLSAFSGRGVRRSMNFVASFFWVIVLPPYLDHFLFGSNQNYTYFSPTDFLNYLTNFSGATFHPGQAAEIITVVFALFGYGVWTQRHYFKTPGERVVTAGKVALLVLSTFFALFFMATPEAYLPVGNVNGVPIFPNFDVTRYYQYHLFIFAYYVLLGVIILFALAYIARRDAIWRVVYSMRPAQTVFFLGMVTAGIAMGWASSGGPRYVMSVLDTPYWINFEFIVLTLITAFLAWQISAVWNDVADRHSDLPSKKGRILASGLVDRSTLVQGSIVMTAVTVLIALLLSVQQALIISAIFLLSFVYSMKPLRLKEHLLSPFLIGLGAFLVILYGLCTPYTVIVELPYSTVHLMASRDVVVPALTATGVLAGTYAFIGLVIGSMVTDVDGYEEDLAGGVKTVYTRLGLERGVKIVGAFVLLSSLTPLLMFNDSWSDFVLFPALGVAATLAFCRYKSSRPVLIVAMVGFVYAAARLLQMLLS
jgi:4-hydroxybenzoate polyprenyltransferase